ncbi:M3 family metallopeptidase [Alicyclobacillus dauci]|uniref:M3 family metallopeptidase n=1 Tax=Alicyclobacillus dauci TaxID=1475485 RepID=A0ABY6YXY0_9BACL|nr:M3 family metallopeptidase [Alicyclobacillus dauci]WAH35417.1 M3 family metallopeptidase [Alicyclobacillus dauci]
MLDNELLDLLSKKGKRVGGYCTIISGAKSPFIFANFNGTAHDVTVLTHEAGHAFMAYMGRDVTTPEYKFPTLEAAEIRLLKTGALSRW